MLEAREKVLGVIYGFNRIRQCLIVPFLLTFKQKQVFGKCKQIIWILKRKSDKFLSRHIGLPAWFNMASISVVA